MKRLLFYFLLFFSFVAAAQEQRISSWGIIADHYKATNGVGIGIRPAAFDSAGNIIPASFISADSGTFVTKYFASQNYQPKGNYLTTQVNADWNATSGAAQILNKPNPYVSMALTGDSLGVKFIKANGSVDTLTGFGGTPISSISLATPNVLYTNPVNFTNTNGAWAGTLSLNNQAPYTLFGRGSGTGQPTFLTGIDGNWITSIALNKITGTAGGIPYFDATSHMTTSPYLSWDNTNNALNIGNGSGTSLLNLYATGTNGVMLNNSSAASLSYYYLKNDIGTIGGMEVGGSTFGNYSGKNKTTFISQAGISVIAGDGVTGSLDAIDLYAGDKTHSAQMRVNSDNHIIFSNGDSTDIINSHNYITQTKGNAYVRDTLFASVVYQNGSQVGTGGGTTYGDAQARAAISLTTTGTSGAATYNNTTGVLNIPQYSALGGTTYTTTDNNLTISGSTLSTKDAPQAFTDGATITIDASLGYNWNGTIAGNRTFAFSNTQSGQYIKINITQDATGSRTVTWPATVKWKGGAAPTLTTTANATDIVILYFNGTNYFGVYGTDFK